MNIKQEIINRLTFLIEEHDLKEYIGKHQFIAAIFNDYPNIKNEIKEIAKGLNYKVDNTLNNNLIFEKQNITLDDAIKKELIDPSFFKEDFFEMIIISIFYSLIIGISNEIMDFIHENQVKSSHKEHFCWECSSRYFYALDLEKKEFVVYKDNHKCINLDNEFKVKIKVNGKIGISNFMRSINLPMNFDGPQLGTSLGDYNEMKRWAKKNVARFNVGNSSPIVWKKGEDIIIGNLFENEYEYDYESSNNKMISEGYEKIGKITTDAWTVCVFNGKAKKDDAEIIIDTSFNTILVEQDQYKNIIKISGIK